MTQKPMIVLTGPTAVGKTALSIELAKKINGAIISADSMQVYKYMDIGSAKVTVDEMDGIKHYLIDELEPSDEFNVFIFKDMAKKALNEIYEAGKIPIVVGGTGFYIQALLYDIDFTKQDVDESYRKSLYDFANEHGNHALHEKLKDIDPASYKSIHENNVKRVIRAIEYYHTCHEPISKHNETERAKQSPYSFAYFVLDDVRQRLYERIDKRVDIMVSNGLVDEVKKLKTMGCTSDMVSMKGIGYKEILAYLDGEYSLDEAVDKVKLESRRFAKRQLTWFRREKDTIWIEKNEYSYDDNKILNKIQEINDLNGYNEGDKQIKACANILIKTQLDNSEIMRTDGNEFVIYLVGYNQKQITNYIHKLSKEIKKLPYDFGAEFGYSTILDDIKTIEDALNEAVEDMMKQKGKNEKEIKK